MYNGEVQIFQDDLDRFLSVAQRFQIKGLLSNKDEVDIPKTEHSVIDEANIVTGEAANQVFDTQNFNKIKKMEVPRTIVAVNNEAFSGLSRRTDQAMEYIEIDEDGSVKCKICGKLAMDKRGKSGRIASMKKHIETHMEGLSYSCEHCSKTFRSKNLKNNHVSVSHRKL